MSTQKEQPKQGWLERGLARLLKLDGTKAPYDFGMAHEQKGQFAYDPNQSRWVNFSGPLFTQNMFGTNIDYSVEAGDLIDNSAVMACMLWIMRTFPEAPAVVKRFQPDGSEKIVPGHSLAKKLTRPNDYYSGKLLSQATTLSFNWNGNAFWLKDRTPLDTVGALWYEPHWNIRPVRASSSEFISYYEIWRDRKWKRIERRDVVHFRYGIDPRNEMLGMSPLASALREVFSDNEAARYAAVMFRNLGVLGGIVMPKSGVGEVDIPDVEGVKRNLTVLSTGDARGGWGVMSIPVEIVFPPSDPSKMDTRGNRKISEERIAALLGVPAVVAQLGAGLDRSTYSNMAEAREAAYESNIIPTQSMFADEIDTQLLSDFGDPELEHVEWDYSKVRVLQDDENRKANKWAVLYNAGIVKRKYALADLGLPVEAGDDVYKGEATPTTELPAPGAAKALTNGHVQGAEVA